MDRPIAWVFVDGDDEKPLLAEPARFISSEGQAVPGYRVWWPRPSGQEGEFQRYIAEGAPRAVVYTDDHIKALKAYAWAPPTPELIGFALIGHRLSSGSNGTLDVPGFGAFDWTVVNLDGQEVMIEWAGRDWPGTYVRSTFRDGVPVPVRTERLGGPTPSTYTAHSFVGAAVNRTPTTPLNPLPAVKLIDGDRLFELPPDQPFTFQEARSFWITDKRYALAQEWFATRPANALVDLNYWVIDENDGNATVYLWEARYLHERDLLTVGAGWRVTHPDPSMDASYPLYDQCPSGCPDPYGGEPRNATMEWPELPGPFPRSGISVASALERLAAMVGPTQVTGLHWRSVIQGGNVYIDEYKILAFTDPFVSIWDPTPDLPEALGGNLERISFPNTYYLEQRLSDGVLIRLQADQKWF